MIGHGQVHLFVIGGCCLDGDIQKTLYRLKCSLRSCEWTTVNQELKIGRFNFVAIPVSESMVSCP